jgi:hypothetical protein
MQEVLKDVLEAIEHDAQRAPAFYTNYYALVCIPQIRKTLKLVESAS